MSRNMYKRHMDKAKGVSLRVEGRDGWGRGCSGEKRETIVLEQQ